MSDITPTRFNPIQVLNKLTTYFGNVLKDKLATKRTPVYPYKVNGDVVEGKMYSIDLVWKDHKEGSTTSLILEYTAKNGETAEDVIQGLIKSINFLVLSDNTPLLITLNGTDYEELIIFTDEDKSSGVYLATSEDGKYLYILGKDNVSVDNNSAPVNMEQTTELKYVSNTIPSAYNAYQRYPVSDYPFITLNLLPSTQVGAQMGYGSRQTAPDEYEVYTDRYLNFSVQVTCDAGKYEDVLNSGTGGSFDVLNTLLARLDDNDSRKVTQEEINCVINPILNSVIPSPQLGDVEYHDVSSVTIDLSTVDQSISGVGVFDTVIYDADYYDFKGGNLVLQTTDGKITINENP